MPDELPMRLGSYELLHLLAQGGMADVYFARQDGLDRYVAVKVLSAHRSRDAESCAMFVDEARIVGMLSHSNLAAVYDVAAEDGVYYLAMEYVHGADLREILQRGGSAPLPLPAAVSIIAAAAAGLDHAHRRCAPDGRPLQLVHRDVSLSNIMVSHDGEVKVIDFGIALSTASTQSNRRFNQGRLMLFTKSGAKLPIDARYKDVIAALDYAFTELHARLRNKTQDFSPFSFSDTELRHAKKGVIGLPDIQHVGCGGSRITIKKRDKRLAWAGAHMKSIKNVMLFLETVAEKGLVIEARAEVFMPPTVLDKLRAAASRQAAMPQARVVDRR